jgi:DUF4097 and DUF4098 domain-containing protein YvlB
MKSSSALTVAALATISLGCTSMFGQQKYQEEFSFTKPLAGLSELTVSNVNGSIEVIGVDGLGEVQISGMKIVKADNAESARDHIGDIRIDIAESSPALQVATDLPGHTRGISYQVNYKIRVPASWKVSAENTNGSVTINTIHGGMNAEVTNGSINASDVAGAMNVTVTNGSIQTDARIPDNASCRLETTNGSISGKLDFRHNTSCSVETTNGGIDLAIPQSASTRVAAETTSGRISTDDLTLTNQEQSRVNMAGAKLRGTLGDGSGNLNIEVMNGSIALKGY